MTWFIKDQARRAVTTAKGDGRGQMGYLLRIIAALARPFDTIAADCEEALAIVALNMAQPRIVYTARTPDGEVHWTIGVVSNDRRHPQLNFVSSTGRWDFYGRDWRMTDEAFGHAQSYGYDTYLDIDRVPWAKAFVKAQIVPHCAKSAADFASMEARFSTPPA
jgi:hypothetical protein